MGFSLPVNATRHQRLRLRSHGAAGKGGLAGGHPPVRVSIGSTSSARWDRHAAYAATMTSTDRQSPIACAVGQSWARTARARSSVSGLSAPSSASHDETTEAIRSPGTRAARPTCKRSMISYVLLVLILVRCRRSRKADKFSEPISRVTLLVVVPCGHDRFQRLDPRRLPERLRPQPAPRRPRLRRADRGGRDRNAGGGQG